MIMLIQQQFDCCFIDHYCVFIIILQLLSLCKMCHHDILLATKSVERIAYNARRLFMQLHQPVGDGRQLSNVENVYVDISHVSFPSSIYINEMKRRNIWQHLSI